MATTREIQDMQMASEIQRPYYADVPFEKPEEKFLEQLNPESICDYIEQKIRARRWDRPTGKWVDTITDPSKAITDEGVNEIMTRVMSIINPNTVYSNLESEIITNIVVDFGIELSRFLSLNYKDYNMKVIDINKITNFCCNMAYISLRRGEEALTLRLLRTMIQSKEMSAVSFKPDGDRKMPWPLSMFNKK